MKYVLDANAAIAAMNDVGSVKRIIAILPVTERVVELYGERRAALEAKGVVKSDFDLIIACTALEQEATLVTSDGALLDDSIHGLRAENWLS